MATTNLISKTLGEIRLQSGNGEPDHTAVAGSIYSDIDTGSVYISKGGGNWEPLVGVTYGEAFYTDNTTATNITTTNVWFQVANNFNLGTSVGFSVDGNKFVLGEGRAGKYHIDANFTIQNVAGLASYDCGISVNGANPVNGSFNTGTINATFIYDNVSVSFDVELEDEDELTLAVRNITNTNNIIVRHGQINVYRVE